MVWSQTKVHIVKSMVFPVVMYRCESWNIRRLSTKELLLSNCGVGKDFLRVPWTTRRSSQSILKAINPEYSLEGLTLKLKLQYFGHLMWRTDSLEKTLMLGKIEDREGDDRGWDGWMASPTRWTWVWANPGRWWRTGKLGVLQSMVSQRVGHDWATEQLGSEILLTHTRLYHLLAVYYLGQVNELLLASKFLSVKSG